MIGRRLPQNSMRITPCILPSMCRLAEEHPDVAFLHVCIATTNENLQLAAAAVLEGPPTSKTRAPPLRGGVKWPWCGAQEPWCGRGITCRLWEVLTYLSLVHAASLCTTDLRSSSHCRCSLERTRSRALRLRARLRMQRPVRQLLLLLH